MSFENQILTNTNFLLVDELGKLVQIRIGDIRDGAILHPLTAPVAPLVSLPETRRMNRRVRFLWRHHKKINEVVAAWIEPGSDNLAARNIGQPPAPPKPSLPDTLPPGEAGGR